jgi:hypothetical protein
MKNQKVGRNDLCPCGNGKKFKKCHGASFMAQIHSPSVPPIKITKVTLHPTNTVPPEVLAKAMADIRERERQEQERFRRFGLVRPEIAAEYHGYKFVAIGNTLLYIPKERCRFLTDVLLAYVPQLFGKEWFEKEIAKAPEERHPVMQWRIKGMNYMNAQPRLPDGSYAAMPTGPLMAYLTFAYDLYVVAHNARLDQRLVERLKHNDQFQGARHELFAEATCLRAGFQIEHENEEDRSSRHAEFTATHLATGQTISVEAKSKHRPGVLGQAGKAEPSNDMNLRFGHLLMDAVAKNPVHPLVVFLDMNMPFEALIAFLPHNHRIRSLFELSTRCEKNMAGKTPLHNS